MLRIILSFIAISLSIICSAHDTSGELHDDLIHKIRSNENFCVQEYTEDRIYLNSENIFPTKQGLYLAVDENDFILLPGIRSDHRGCYVYARQILNTCPYCGLPYFVRCRNKDCPGKKK